MQIKYFNSRPLSESSTMPRPQEGRDGEMADYSQANCLVVVGEPRSNQLAVINNINTNSVWLLRSTLSSPFLKFTVCEWEFPYWAQIPSWLKVSYSSYHFVAALFEWHVAALAIPLTTDLRLNRERLQPRFSFSNSYWFQSSLDPLWRSACSAPSDMTAMCN